jgi:hypothetical protein
LEAYGATQKPHNTGKTLPAINTYANFIAFLIPHYCKDDRGDIEVVEERINDFHLFFLRPDSTWPFVSVRVTEELQSTYLVGMMAGPSQSCHGE